MGSIPAGFRIQPIGEIDASQIQSLARLHQAGLPSLLSQMGLPLIERFYLIVRDDPRALGFFCLDEIRTLLGWVVGTDEPGRLYEQLKRPLPVFLAQIALEAARRPGLVAALLQSQRSAAAPLGKQPGAVELLYIAVAPQVQGRGVGGALIEAFAREARWRGFTLVTLSVETDNRQALQVYLKKGFVQKGLIQEVGFTRYRMELPLQETSIEKN